MPNRQDLPPMSKACSQARLENAHVALGAAVTTRIVALALYLLGAELEGLAQFIGMRMDTIKAFAKRALRDGLPALEDRRHSRSEFLARNEAPRAVSCELRSEADAFAVDIDGVNQIKLMHRHDAHCRVVLLTLLEAGLLQIGDVARALKLSRERTNKLCKQLRQDGLYAVLDKRRGQQQDYRVGPQQKSELIQQLAARAISGQSTSSEVLASVINENTRGRVSARSVRSHIEKLGLKRIKQTLPQLVEAQKKTSGDC